MVCNVFGIPSEDRLEFRKLLRGTIDNEGFGKRLCTIARYDMASVAMMQILTEEGGL
jgi:hypothetical protein